MKSNDSLPETDAHGFAATNVVRVRPSRNRGRVRFYRVWMKPDDLAFPPHERRIVGQEELAMIAKYIAHQAKGNDGPTTMRLSAGGMPQTHRAGSGGRDSSKNFCAPKKEATRETFRWSCPHCGCLGWTNAIRGEREPDNQLRARVTADAFDQHAHVADRCISDELEIVEDNSEGATAAGRALESVGKPVNLALHELHDDGKYAEAERMAGESKESQIFDRAYGASKFEDDLSQRRALPRGNTANRIPNATRHDRAGAGGEQESAGSSEPARCEIPDEDLRS